MANQKNNLEFDDLDDFDFDLPDTGTPGSSGSRNPISQLSSSFAAGVKDDLIDRRDVARKIKMALPQSYTTSVDLADDAAETVGDLYNTIRRETRESVQSAKRVGRGALEKNGDKLPKGLRAKLDGLLKDTSTSGTQIPTQQQIRNAEVENTVNSIFRLAESARDGVDTGDDSESSRQNLRDRISQIQGRTAQQSLNLIQSGVNRQVTYQDQIAARYQSKMLELQYRQFFTARDLLTVTEGATRDIKEALQAVVKNTAMPDYQKLQFTEAGGQMLRDQLLANIQNSAMELGGGSIRNFRRNLVANVKDRVGAMAGSVTDIASAVEMAQDSGVQISPYEVAGQQAGSFATQQGFKRLSPKARQLIENNPRLAALGLRLQNLGMNFPRLLNQWSKEDHGYGLKGGLLNFFASSLESQYLDPKLKTVNIENSREPAQFDNITRKSITDIIPGYLSRIHHELSAFRNGMGIPSPDPDSRLVYDLKRRDFESRQNTIRSVRDDIIRPDEAERARDQMDRVYGSLDIDHLIDPDQKNQVQKELTEYMTRVNLSGDSLDLRNLTKEQGLSGFSEEIRDTIADAIKQRYNVNETEDAAGRTRTTIGNDTQTQEQLTRLNRSFNNLTRVINDPKQRIEAYSQLGNEDIVRDLGLLTTDERGRSHVNYDTVLDVMEKGGYQDTREDPEYIPGITRRMTGDSVDDEAERRRYNRYWRTVDERETQRRENERQAERRRQWAKSREGRLFTRTRDRFDRVKGRSLKTARYYAPNAISPNVDPNAVNRANRETRGVDYVPPETTGERVQRVRENTTRRINQTRRDVGQRVQNLRRSQTPTEKEVDNIQPNVTSYFRNLTPYVATARSNIVRTANQVATETDPSDQSIRQTRAKQARADVQDLKEKTPDRIGDQTKRIRNTNVGEPNPSVSRYTENSQQTNQRSSNDNRSFTSRVRESETFNRIATDFEWLKSRISDRFDNNVRWTIRDKDRNQDPQHTERSDQRDSKSTSRSRFDNAAKTARQTPEIVRDEADYSKGQTSNQIGNRVRQTLSRDNLDKQAERIRNTDYNELGDNALGAFEQFKKWSMDRFNAIRQKPTETPYETDTLQPNRGSDTNVFHFDRADSQSHIGRRVGASDTGASTRVSAPSDASDVVRPTQESSQSQTLASTTPKAPLTATLKTIQDILTGDQPGVGRKLDDLYRYVTNSDETNPSQQAQYAVLCRILETVEAIGQGVATDDKQSAAVMNQTTNKNRSILATVGRGLGDYYAGAFKLFGGGLAGTGSALAGAGRGVGNLLSRPFSGDRKAVDIYVKGEREPALEAQPMRKGQYIDSITRKKIKTINDLKRLQGDVLRFNPQTKQYEVAVTATKLAEGLYDRLGQPIGGPGLLGSIKNSAGSLVSGYMNLTTAPLRAVGNAVAGSYNTTKNFMSRTPDVYVKGETTPRLISTVMRNGGYVNQSTNEPITKIEDIDGTVVDRSGNVVLTLQDMAQGLVDRKGRPIKFLDRQVDRAKRWLKKPVDLARKGYGKASEKVTSLMDSYRDRRAAKSKVDRAIDDAESNNIGSEQLKVLKEIRDILSKDQKGRYDDTDGDGDRDNGWRDIFQRRKAEAAAKEEADDSAKTDKPKEKGGGILKKLLPYILPVAGMLMTQVKNVLGFLGDGLEAIIDKILKILSGAGIGRGISRALGGDRGFESRKRRRGMTNRRRVKGVGNALGKTGRFLGKAGRGIASGARIAGGALAASSAASWIGTGVSAIAGTISLPVIAAGAVAVGAGIGGYYLWKHFTKKKLGKLVQHRMMQYGIDPSDTDRTAKILWLEDRIKNNVTVSQDGQVNFDFSDLNISEMVEQFDGDPADQMTVDRFGDWFNTRFLSVYVAAAQGQAQMVDPTSLADVDNASAIDQLAFFKKARKVVAGNEEWPDPYTVVASPFNPQERLTIPKARIIQNGQALLNQLSKAVAEEKEKNPSVMGAAMPTRRLPKPDDSTIVDQVAMPYKSQSQQNEAGSLLMRNRSRNTTPAKEQNLLLRNSKETYQVDAAANIPGLGAKPNTSQRQLPAEKAMLFKAMGLKELEVDKVATLESLIDYVLSDIRITAKGEAVYGVDAVTVYQKFQGEFGNFSTSDVLARQRWIRWFKDRFLVSLLNFITAIKTEQASARQVYQQAGQDPAQAGKAGQVLKAQETTINGDQSVSVWSIVYSPWPKYQLNSKSNSIDAYIAYFDSQTSGKVLTSKGSDTDTDQDTESEDDKPQFDFTTEKGREKLQNRIEANRRSAAKALLEKHRKLKEQQRNADITDNPFDFDDSTTYSDNPNLSGGSTYNGYGEKVKHPGNGTGGNINDLPMPTGKQGWASFQDLIVSASKMAGVDPGVMATMAAIESNFRSGARAASSSATGLYQFVDDTWKEMLNRYANKYGISKNAKRTDPRANALMGAEFLKENQRAIEEKITGRDVTDTDLYAAHFLGASGARLLLSSDPGKDASYVLPKAANSNPSIFKDKNGQDRTVAGVYNELNRRVKTRSDRYADSARKLAKASVKPDDKADQALSEGQGAETPLETADTSVATTTDTAVATADTNSETPVSGLSTFRDSLDESNAPKPEKRSEAPRAPLGVSLSDRDDSDKEVAKQRSVRVQNAVSRDRRAKETNDRKEQKMGELSDVLSKSLDVQRSMDERLEELVEVTKAQKKQNAEENQRATERDKVAAQARKDLSESRARSNRSLDSLSDTVVDMSRSKAG